MRADRDAGPATDVWRAPRPGRSVRVAAALVARLPVPSLDPEELIARARRRAGLDDLGGPEVHDGLARLCCALDAEADLTPLGRHLARDGLVAALVNRLEIVDWVAGHPDTTDGRIDRPIFVVGLPRTGTTLLHRLLAADPAHRAPLWWEGMRPCPPPATVDRSPDPRVRQAERSLRMVERAIPGFRAIHDSSATEPEECVQLMGNDLTSLVFAIQYWVPSYWDWLESTDLTTAYRNHRRQLQVLQWGDAPRRWVLKAPAHLFALPAIAAVYPDALVVHTHRDPVVATASTCSLIAAAHSAARRRVDPIDVGRAVLDRLAGWSARARADREQLERDPASKVRFVDVEYDDLVADPMDVVGEVYRRDGPALGDAARQAMHAHLTAHPQHEHGVHRYALGPFGLDEAAVRAAFAAARPPAGAAKMDGQGTGSATIGG